MGRLGRCNVTWLNSFALLSVVILPEIWDFGLRCLKSSLGFLCLFLSQDTVNYASTVVSLRQFFYPLLFFRTRGWLTLQCFCLLPIQDLMFHFLEHRQPNKEKVDSNADHDDSNHEQTYLWEHLWVIATVEHLAGEIAYEENIQLIEYFDFVLIWRFVWLSPK